ncbi:MAG: hypothetical protein M3512_06900 [Bacteroidota bacterium]|nr:hypothetical protein [Bacteroidota bacterium]
MSIKKDDLSFIFKILSLLLILLVVNVRNKMDINFQLANKMEIKEYSPTEEYNIAAQKFVKSSVTTSVGWQSIEARNK